MYQLIYPDAQCMTFTQIWVFFRVNVNVGKYTIHWAYGRGWISESSFMFYKQQPKKKHDRPISDHFPFFPQSYFLQLMEEILHQLIWSTSIYKVLYISQVVQDFFHQQYAKPCDSTVENRKGWKTSFPRHRWSDGVVGATWTLCGSTGSAMTLVGWFFSAEQWSFGHPP